MLSIGPVLPRAAPHERVFEIRNPGDEDIEIFSLDFDAQAFEEEERLAKLPLSLYCNEPPSGREPAFLRLPIRAPAEPLPDWVIEMSSLQT
jgi:hypothetical protein